MLDPEQRRGWINFYLFQNSFCVMLYSMENLFVQFKSAVLIQFSPSSFPANGLGLGGGCRYWCIVSIVFLLEPVHSIILDILNKTIPSQQKPRQPLKSGLNAEIL